MKHLEKALNHIRKNVDMEYINFCVCHAMEMRCPFSLAYPLLADDISDLLEEYGEDTSKWTEEQAKEYNEAKENYEQAKKKY